MSVRSTCGAGVSPLALQVTVVTFGVTMLSGPDVPVLIACMALAPSATLSGFITFLQEVRNVIKCAINFECAAS